MLSVVVSRVPWLALRPTPRLAERRFTSIGRRENISAMTGMFCCSLRISRGAGEDHWISRDLHCMHVTEALFFCYGRQKQAM